MAGMRTVRKDWRLRLSGEPLRVDDLHKPEAAQQQQQPPRHAGRDDVQTPAVLFGHVKYEHFTPAPF